MTMLSPMGRVPRRRPSRGRPNRRHTPVAILLSVLVVIATIVWWQVFHPSDGSTSNAVACQPDANENVASIDPATVQVRVYNSTDRAGLAGDVSGQLTKRGFTIAATANDPLDRAVNGVGEIRYGTAGEQQAAFLSFHVPGAELLIDERTGPVIDLALGPDFQQLAHPADATAAAKQAAAQAAASPDASAECSMQFAE